MGKQILIRRGTEANLPALEDGEPGWATDTKTLYVGDGDATPVKIGGASVTHDRKHAITSTDDHSSTATAGKMLKADANGLPVEATNTDADVADAVTKKHSNALDHAAVTVTAPISLSGQALSIVNDAAGTITQIDTGTLSNLDTDIPTSKAVRTAIGTAVADLKGYREGLDITIKDADEIYVSGGAIDIAGIVYISTAQLTVSLGSVSPNTSYYIYVDAPASGTTLAATDFTVSATVPVFNDSLGAKYMTGDTTKRYIGTYFEVT